MNSLNLSSFKKIKSDKKSSTLKNKDGHEIKIAHSSLRPEQLKALQKMPIHADTGTVVPPQSVDTGSGQVDIGDNTPDPTIQPSTGSTPAASDDANNFLTHPISARTTEERLPEADPNLPGAGAPVGGPDATPANPDTKMASAGDSSPDINALYKQGQDAIQEQKDYETKLSQANAGVEQSDLDARQNVMDGFNKNYQDFQAEQKKFMADYINNKIDPKHYIENMSAPQRAATAIGLFLGGWGSAYTHQGNPAMDFLNKQIDRDIDAQKSRLDQQKTLLGANQEMFHDSVMANNATRMNMNDIYSHQLQLQAAKLGTPAAKAKADAAAAQFGIQNQQLLWQNSMRATVMHAMQNGGQGLTAQHLQIAGYMTPEQAEKEQTSVDAQKKAVQGTKDIFSRLEQEQTAGNLLNPQSYARRDALRSELINTVLSAAPSGKLSREAIEAEVEPFMPKTRDTTKTSQAQLNGVLNVIGRHADPTPMMTQYAPKALPQYPYQMANQKPQYSVGQQLFVGGQKVQIINNKGDYRPVK